MEQFTEISKFFKTEFPLNQHGLDELFSLFKVEKHAKGSILLQENSKEKQLRFLNNGIVREYYANKEREINIYFYTKP